MQGQNSNPAQTQQPQSGNSSQNIGSHIGKPEQGQSGAPSTQPQVPKPAQPPLPGAVRSAASEHTIQIPGDDKNKQGKDPQGKGDQPQQNAKQAQALQNAFSNTTIHMMSPEEAAQKLQTNFETGLTAAAVKERQEKDGPNVLTPPKQPPWIVRQSKHFIGGFQVLMIAGGILCCVVYGIDRTQSQTLWIGIALFVVVIVTGIFESFQEGRASSLMAGFKNLTESTASVIRDGHRITIPSSELVLGDVCMLEGGQKVTADIRILESRGLKVDNSTLTGEPEPLRRVPECTNNSPAETRNLAFSGTYFTEGSGKGVVFGIGDKTVLGSISTSANEAKRPESTLRKEVRHFVTRMAIIAFAIAIAFVVIGVAKEHITWQTAIVFFIAGVVANIPEGLLPQMTAQLTLVARRMLHRHVLVKNLEIIETLGCTTCVASDKTGTLTQNRMTVAHMWYDLQFYGTLPHDRDAPEPDVTGPTFQQLHRIATLCNRAVFVPKQGEALDVTTTAVKGDASETALLRFVQPLRDAVEYRTANPVVGDIPFNSTNKWALTAHKLEDGSYALMMKGAPERILSRCTTIAINGEQMPMEQHAHQVVEANRALGRRGERVLAFACLALPSSVSETVLHNLGEGDPPPEIPLDQMCFVGLMSLLDPPRQGVAGAIAECHKASIRVIMVTGDHPETARSIAKTIGIMPGRTAEEQADFEGVPIEQVDKNHVEAIVIHTADQLPGFTEDDWNYTLSRKQVVFARSLPAQKQKIVQELQARGHIVAVTGDGTNDCPALRQAACGVAMGISGSDIAKNAAQIVLLDDNFCSLVAGIQEGRLIFHNMKKCILYTISHLMPELFPFLMLITARLPLAIETVMLLVIDCGTELVPSVALAWENGEANFMEQPPRNVKTARLATPQLLFMAYIVTGLWEVFVCFWAFFWAFAYYGFKFVDLFGTGRDWETVPYQLSPESVQMYNELALKNEVWQRGGGSAHGYTDFYEYRQHALNVAQSAYLYGIVICQFANIMCCRSRYESLFKRPANKWIFLGILVALIVINIVVYVPVLNGAFGAATLPAQWIFISTPAIPIMIFFEELRKYCIRRWPRGCVARFTDY